ncbi:uncharacterized protein LOC128199834 [Bicyclus anynana]|uniref:Uncharacterized protein LOC128199834 n=1 Tax=Bicyclus anynana TaxID=110368 RepID=A0ABM3M668_BICAN|nr:uncharacterized protein LOC128199834 [Bicyclus anynana]
MPKCSACGRFLSSAGATNCTGCQGLYHMVCVGLVENGKLPKLWKCPECLAKRPKKGNVDTPVKAAETSCSDGDEASTELEMQSDVHVEMSQSVELGRELRLIREQLQHIRNEIKDFRSELNEVRSSIAACNLRVDTVNDRLLDIEKEILAPSKKSKEIEKLESTVAKLKVDINDRDQDLLRADIEITNLPETRGKNPCHTVAAVAAKLGVALSQNDIVFAERVGKKDENSSEGREGVRGRRIVARLSRPSLRDDFLRCARTRRGTITEGMEYSPPHRRFYINERLTRTNKHLFYLVRETAKQKQWKFTWTKLGKIFARHGEGKVVHQIKSESDLERVFGIPDVGPVTN